MAFERYEVWEEDASGAPVVRVWGPSHSLARAEQVAQETADKTRRSTRIDSVIYDRIGDPDPEFDPIEFFDPTDAPSSADDDGTQH
jgi:hypothetical protein